MVVCVIFMMKTNAAFNTKLAEVVEKYPLLYNYTLKGYSNRNEVDKQWAKVATEMNETVENCKEAWRNLRIAFTRSLKTKSGGATKKKYYLFDKLQFILPYVGVVRRKSLLGNLPSPGPLEEDNEKVMDDPPKGTEVDNSMIKNISDDNEKKDLHLSTSTSIQSVVIPTKRKSIDPVDKCLMEYINFKSKKVAPQPVENTRKLFLLSLQSDVDEMTPSQFRLFKRKVGVLVEEIFNADNQAVLFHSANSYSSTRSSPMSSH